MVYANLRQAHGYFEKSSLYRALDPTEKSGVSYFMGMMAAKIVGARLLDVPWLFHLSMINAIGGTAVLKGKSQPDLIGLRRNRDWVVVEAKGRTFGYSASAMSSAKLQTRQLRQVNGSYPSLRVAVQAYFAPQLQWALVDPEEFDEDASDLNFDEEKALEMYYSASVAATADGAEEREMYGRKFLTKAIAEIGVSVAIDRDVRERIVTRTLARREGDIKPQGTASPDTDGDFAIFGDGLAIALDGRWSAERMERDPVARLTGRGDG